MHELGITQSVVEAVLDAVAEPRITRLQLEIGKLSGVMPDSVRFCFDLVAQGTALEGACLDIVEPAGSGRCHACGIECELSDPIVLCSCGSADVTVLSGQRLRVRSVEVA
ncbi:hydrogenase nickel incorporation protein HypA/HybF [Halopolyspora algeriensis]|uniref:Hydrogenase maturation factor HypA n=1 Tax=Halopolyspora algeriensis TaxID=1500506 RepID=A0A368VGT0_9ACTN|nr:hydrogenase maturation nickel metallochaperone HypA [Halopolyspora algeriensis]RCW40389.1 hydrogenase nickel incorporation protein HypA/HybF [Halopolyspora algeriensis]TQM53673.1 hydrogenase-3 nickel incorporation protein HypA [Halopolyspora algeriensis]